MYFCDEPLGMDELGYFNLCPSLLPHLKGKTREGSNRYITKYLGISKISIDEDVEMIYSDILHRVGGELEEIMIEDHPEAGKKMIQVPTSYGCHKIDLAATVSKLVEKGATRAGRNRIKDAIIYYLLYELAYPEIQKKIVMSFDGEELVMVRDGLIHLAKRFQIEIKDEPLLIDRYFFLLFDKERWRNSILDHPVILERSESKEKMDFTKMTTSDFKRRVCATFKRVSETVDNFFTLVDKKHEETIAKIMKEVKNPRNGIFVVSYIYAINCAEREMGMRVVKNKKELCDIFGMSERDFYRKLQFFAH